MRIAHPPLTPAVLHILLALSTKDRYGYGIMKQVKADSRGKVTMGPGTLYGSLGLMTEAGFIRESDKKPDPERNGPGSRDAPNGRGERRIYYQLTGLGQEALAAELARYREVVAVAEHKRLSPKVFAGGA